MDSWDYKKALVVYRDAQYELGQKDGMPYLIANGATVTMTCHPYEPCLYVHKDGGMTVVHNAFEPFDVLQAFAAGKTILGITGREYAPRDFCRMVEYAAGMGDVGIQIAESVLGSIPAPAKAPKKKPVLTQNSGVTGSGHRIEDAQVGAVLAACGGCVVDVCIVETEHEARGKAAHRRALGLACKSLMDGYVYNLDMAQGSPIISTALFAADAKKLNFRKAFLQPPHGCDYAEDAFSRLTEALFPGGTRALEAFEWTTNWSAYFDDGREWWGTLCNTVYDRACDRFVVILASATD